MIDQEVGWYQPSRAAEESDEPRPLNRVGESAPAPWRFSTRAVAVRLFVTCWLIYGLHFATNTVREIYPVLSLGDHLSFDVSEYAGLHPDVFEVPGRGAYINNNPGASILGAIPYALARPVTDRIVEYVKRTRAANPEAAPSEYQSQYPMAREFYRKAYERGLDVKFGLAAVVTQAFCMAPLSALSVVVMFYILLSLTSSVRTSLVLSLLYAIATPVFYRTAQLNQNLLMAHFALFAFALLWRPWDDPQYPRRPRYLLAGLCCGWTVVLDYSGVVVLLVLSAYGLIRRRSLPAESKSRADIWHFALGVTLCAAFLLAYQWAAFGNPLYPAQHYMPQAAFTEYGYRGMDAPHPDLLWQTAFGMRFGLFTSAPLLLLALYVPAWFKRQLRLVEFREALCILILSMAFFLFCASNQYTRMQFNTGVRHIVPVVPFLFLLAAGVLLKVPRLMAVLIGIITSYWSWCLVMYRDVERGVGVFESLIHVSFEGFRLPWMITLEQMGYLTRASAAPLLLLTGAVVCAIWTVKVGNTGQPARSFAANSRI
jgi:hypothetical protein